MTDKVQGSDGSHWNGVVSFSKMFQGGSKFHIYKASDSYRGSGKLFEDKRFDNYSQQAFSLGELLLGCFHWLQPDCDPYEAADFYLDRYFRYPFHFMPVLDFEETYAYQRKDENGNIVPTRLESHYCWCAEVWLDKVERATGKLPMVYSAKWFTDHFPKKLLSWLKRYLLWVAQYPYVVMPWTQPSLPYPWDKYRVWQYSADGNRKGAQYGVSSDDIDLNWFPGTYQDLLDWLGVEAPKPMQPSVPSGRFNIVLTGTLAIRNKPTADNDISNVLRYALPGDTLTGYERTVDNWYRIGKDKEEWISGRTRWTTITEIMDPIPLPEPTPEPPVIIKPTLAERVTRVERNQDKLLAIHPEVSDAL